MRRPVSVVVLIVLLVLSSGCYHYHLRTSGNKANSSYFRKTLDPSSEGRRSNYVVPPPGSGATGASGLPSAGACQENGLYEVGITSPWKYAAGRVFSFGLWSRVKVEWMCAKEPPVIGPAGLEPQPPTASAAAVSAQPKSTKDGFTRRTVHAFLWGALQQNLLPPGSKTMKTPANCQSMRQVKLPMNYGYALLTVLSAGIWSPMQVAWKCDDQSAGGSNAKAAALPAKEGNHVR